MIAREPPYRRSDSLDVCRGEFLTIVGASGTGKTTLLRLLGGLTPGEQRNNIRSMASRSRARPTVLWSCSRTIPTHCCNGAPSPATSRSGLKATSSVAALKERVNGRFEMVGLERCAERLPLAIVRRHAAARPDCASASAAAGGHADGRAVRRARRHDQGGASGRTAARTRRTGTSFVFITHDIEEAVYLGDRVVVLGGPPGRIHKIVPVELARPRHQIETRQTAEFLRHRLGHSRRRARSTAARTLWRDMSKINVPGTLTIVASPPPLGS